MLSTVSIWLYKVCVKPGLPATHSILVSTVSRYGNDAHGFVTEFSPEHPRQFIAVYKGHANVDTYELRTEAARHRQCFLRRRNKFCLMPQSLQQAREDSAWSNLSVNHENPSGLLEWASREEYSKPDRDVLRCPWAVASRC